MKHTGLIALFLLAGPPQGMAADVVQPEPAALTIPTTGDDLKNCAFITNDCEVCSVAADGKSACTSTGIACTPTKRWCLVPKK